MSDLWRWVIGLAVIAHGIGHVLFMPVLIEAMKVDATGRSWFLEGPLGDGPARILASVAGAVALVAFVIAGAGIVGHVDWWRPVAFVGALVSIGLIVAMWGGLQTSSAVFGLAFDLVVVVALVLHAGEEGLPA